MVLLAGLAPAWSGVASAAADWTGSWETKWRGGGARLDLQQSGDRVTGHYPLYGGDIEALASGRELKGRWIAGPRNGAFVFTMSPDGRSFAGRYDNGEWWTGGRTTGAAETSPPDRSDVRETVRTFVQGGNLADAGRLEELGAAAAVIDVGKYPQPVLQNERLRIAKELHDLVNLTTFQIWSLPGKTVKGDTFTAKLRQAGTDVVLALELVRGKDGQWSIVAPPEDELATLRKALLARSGGRPLEPSAYLKLRTARDTVTAFEAAFADWDRDGQQRAIATLDTSRLYPATREYEAGLAAQYLKLVLDRVSTGVPQEIPDDPADRQPYVVVAHPAGDIVIAPTGEGDKTVWRFTPQTLDTIRTLYAAVEGMPLSNARAVESPPSAFFAERRWVRSLAPALMQPIGPVELWQILAGILGALACLLAATVVTAPLTRLLSWKEGERSRQAERALRWPLRIAVAALLFKLLIPYFGWPEEVRRYSAPIHAIVIGVFGVWAAWFLIDLLTAGMMERARKSARSLDDISISLVSVTVRLTVFFVAVTYVATELAIPTNGILAGLGISGLAVAFASKETLSNVFGAGVLVADRPFKKGDLITAGDIKGTVEQVGIRSTRIRTAEDTQVIVPNGKLSDASINNWGLRSSRLFQTRILVAYGASATKLDAYLCELRRLFAAHEAVAANRTDIGLAALNDKTVGIDVTTYLRVANISEERAVKSGLILAALRLAEEQGIAVGDTPDAVAPERPPEPRKELETAAQR